MSIPSINFLHLMVCQISPGQDFIDQGHYGNVIDQSNQSNTMTLHTYNHQPMTLPSIKFSHLMVSDIEHRQDFKGQGHFSKVKSRSHHDIAHLHPLTNIPTKYRLPTPYSFRGIAQTNLFPPPTQTPWVKTVP